MTNRSAMCSTRAFEALSGKYKPGLYTLSPPGGVYKPPILIPLAVEKRLSLEKLHGIESLITPR